MIIKALKLDKLRREKKYTWIALSNATGIPSRTLQDIDNRESKKDITQIGTGVKRRLEKIAELWGIEYEELFETISDEESIKDDADEMEEAFYKFKDYVFYDENVTDEAKKTFINLLHDRFTKGNFETCAMRMLAADFTELNALKGTTIQMFVEQCKENQKQNIIDRLVTTFTDERFTYHTSVLLHFAMELEKNEFVDASKEIYTIINREFND